VSFNFEEMRLNIAGKLVKPWVLRIPTLWLSSSHMSSGVRLRRNSFQYLRRLAGYTGSVPKRTENEGSCFRTFDGRLVFLLALLGLWEMT